MLCLENALALAKCRALRQPRAQVIPTHMLLRFASAAAQPPRSAAPKPRLFLELKNAAYTPQDAAEVWDQAQHLRIAEHVALWAFDAAHYNIIKSAAGGAINVIWGYMDRAFSDVVSDVPFPAPVPPQVEVSPGAALKDGNSASCCCNCCLHFPRYCATLCSCKASVSLSATPVHDLCHTWQAA